ncbi:amino acid adenylation domain-containing protein [Nostoc flagelliforme FACHB-838]|uniref:Amino acid adenylation domain-containing protein n=1 Tax=Nostoc flagelliforme FACHB-838 TaxID=2692904 RepID=A0ABR8DK51_9NOSO|nr:non-ribosomal peptide synthetase [Nostoc flagelliforme]MBD2529847.1 amino acid adenylation domain-containing protein [Nostoc flagelliforme FACHB-838]
MKTIEEFLSYLCSLDIKLWVENDRLRCSAPKEALTPDIKGELAARKTEILTFISQANQALQSISKSIQPVPRQGNIPLSFAQQRLWFFSQIEPNSNAYNIPVAIRLIGKLNVAALSKSINEIIRRHEILRTKFNVVDGEAIQVIHNGENFTFTVIDLQALPEDKKQQEVQNLAVLEAQKPFDIVQDCLIRTTLIQLSETDHVILLTMHHIVSDGWSTGIFIKEITALYTAFSQGQFSPLPELPIQYADFAIWQRKWLQGEVIKTQLNYWKQQLGGNLPILELPSDRPRPAIQSHNGATQPFQLSKSLTEKLKSLSQREGVTLFMTLLAAFKVLLYRYTQQEDIIVGTPIANRNRAEIEGLIGFFVNTLVLRTNFSNNTSFRKLLQQVREVTLGAYAHQDLPFERLVEELQPGRDLSHSPLFQVMFVLQNAAPEFIQLPELTLQPLTAEKKTAKFDITLSLSETEAGVQGDLEYNTDIFDAARITRMLGHFQILLEGVVANPQQNLSELPLLTTNEQHKLLLEWNNTKIDYPQDQCIHQIFEAQVEKTPDAVAVVFENQQLTYHELNIRANQLAHYLQKQGVKPEVLVGICVERSLEMVIGILAILKAGGAYVPLDPAYPKERLGYMLADAQVAVLLTQKHLLETLPAHNAQTVYLDSDEHLLLTQSTANPISNATSQNLAYVIYTSGSTGQPKGVLIDHSDVVRLFAAVQPWYNFHQQDVWTLFHSYAFDFSVWEIWGALLYGGKLVVVPYWVSRTPEAFYELLSKEQVTVLNQTPSAFRQLIQVEQSTGELKDLNLRLVIFGGEALDIQSLQPWFARHGDESPQLVNMYGITETTVHVTYRPLTKADLHTTASVIGRPIPDLQVYLLDKNQQLVPIGVPGEMYIGGAGLARGYLNRPDITQERFIVHPLSKQGKLYKSGDLARYLPNGDIEYLGRIDHQVKIRGFRIEIGEIKAAIHQHPEIRETIVIVREDIRDDKRLVAYIVPQSTNISVLELRNFLKAKLVDYMIPSAFVVLEKFPLTPNDKIDRRALPAPDIIQHSEENTYLTLTPIQELLTGIWAEILGIKQLGIHDNFFELGAHSLLVTRVISQIRNAFKVELPLRCVFESPTVAELAKEIEKVKQAELHLNLPTIERASRLEKIPLSFSQQRLWYLDQLQPNSTAFNIFAAVRIVGLLNISALEQSFNEIVRRHEILRTNFTVVDGEPIQVIAPFLTLKINIVDLSELPDVEREYTANELAQQEAVKPFSLDKEPLVRVTLITLTKVDYILLLTMHHIISDGWSTGVLIKELIGLYKAFCLGKPSPLPELSIQYADFAIWQRQCFRVEVLKNQLSYWKQQLKNLPILKLPTDYPRSDIAMYRGSKKALTLNSKLIENIKSINLQEGTTLFMTLLAAFKAVLHYYGGQEDIVVGTDVANRNISETEGLIGFFVNQLVLRTSVDGNPTFSELLQRIREVTLGAWEHQDLPFDVLVNALNPERNLNLSPLFQVKFVFDNTQTQTLKLPDLTISSIEIPKKSTQLDLILRLTETPQGIIANLEYNIDIFTSATITQMLSFWEIVLIQVVNNSTIRLQELVDAIAAVDEEQRNLAKVKHKQDIQQKIKTIKRKTLNHKS